MDSKRLLCLTSVLIIVIGELNFHVNEESLLLLVGLRKFLSVQHRICTRHMFWKQEIHCTNAQVNDVCYLS